MHRRRRILNRDYLILGLGLGLLFLFKVIADLEKGERAGERNKEHNEQLSSTRLY